MIVSAVVIFYTLFGGFLAVSYTDVVQGLIMFFALLLVPIVGIFITGGFTETAASIRAVDPQLLNFVSGATFLGDFVSGCVGAWLFRSATYYRPLYGA